MRHLFGKLNKFSVAPGSISDISSGAQAYPLSKDLRKAAIAEKTPVTQV